MTVLLFIFTVLVSSACGVPMDIDAWVTLRVLATSYGVAPLVPLAGDDFQALDDLGLLYVTECPRVVEHDLGSWTCNAAGHIERFVLDMARVNETQRYRSIGFFPFSEYHTQYIPQLFRHSYGTLEVRNWPVSVRHAASIRNDHPVRLA